MRSSGLTSLLHAAIDDLSSLPDAALAFPASAIAGSLQAESVDAVCVAARIAGHFQGCGLQGRWDATFRTPVRIRFGQSITMPVRAVTVEGDAIDCAGSLRPLGRTPIDDSGYVLLAGEEDADALCLDANRRLAAGDMPWRIPEMRAAIDLIRAGAPDYVGWCSDAVRVVAAWPGDPERTNSASFAGQLGVIYMSSPLNPVRIAETLVHEASHQYFHLAQSATRLHTLLDETDYWQPYVRAHRRIERILLAYHAFANVVLFHRRLLDSLADDDLRRRAAHALEHHEPNVALLDRYLERSNGLTPAGRSLYRTVAERVAA
jgi:HEXXH motif-containing protein